MNKPFSQACENNKGPILTVLKQYFAETKSVLEIGSGTGQHAVYFAHNLPNVTWQCSDALSNHAGIQQWISAYPSANLLTPISFVIGTDTWPDCSYDAVYSANTAHIMQKYEVKLMMSMIREFLPAGGLFCQYGPFTQNGEFNSKSNAEFDLQLTSNGYGGIRDINELQFWGHGLELIDTVKMPANNLTLVWRKV
jgi:cyclopropane fatty-acyl-phospholipid synthase-like methyltransferase